MLLLPGMLMEGDMLQPSTFSIAAYSREENAWGVAVASKFPAVGSVVPWVEAGVGAVATQALANTSFGPAGLRLMRSGQPAAEALEQLLSADENRDHRQVGMVDQSGRAATFTGPACMTWAGGLTGDGYAIQGNILAGEYVIHAMAAAYVESTGSIVDRLYAALLAGDRAGGDRRGKQSAAIYLAKPGGGYAGFNDRWIDYRIDDDPEPVVKLAVLLELHRLYFEESPVSDRVAFDPGLVQRLQGLLSRLGYYHGEEQGVNDEETTRALSAFLGSENFEERCDPSAGWIDRPVLDYIFRRFGEER